MRRLHKFLLSFLVIPFLVGCNKKGEKPEAAKLTGLVGQEISYYVGEENCTVSFEVPSLLSYKTEGKSVIFDLNKTGTTQFKVLKDGSQLRQGTVSIYNFSYKGERSTVLGRSTTVSPVGVEGDYKFASSDNSIAQINNSGVIFPIKEGSVDISLTYDGATYSRKFYVIPQTQELDKFYIDGGEVNFFGRNDFSNDGVTFYNGASGFEVKFAGKYLKANMSGYFASYYGYSKIQVEVDDMDPYVMDLNKGSNLFEYTLCGPIADDLHVVRVYKVGECGATEMFLNSLTTDGYFLYANEKRDLKIEVYGDSITAGYGNMRGAGTADGNSAVWQNTMHTYELYAARELNAECNIMARSGIGLQFAENIVGDFNMNTRYEYMHPLSTVKWNMHNYIPDVVVINLGTNDAWNSSKFVRTDFVGAYVQLVENLIGWYGYNTKYVISCGLMSQGNAIFPVLQSDIYPQLLALGVEVECLKFTNSTSGGHPLDSEHRIAGALLAETINNLL